MCRKTQAPRLIKRKLREELISSRPFEHEARLKQLLGRQAELNAALHLDKGERQIAPEAGAKGSVEVDWDAGADERAAGADVRSDNSIGAETLRRVAIFLGVGNAVGFDAGVAGAYAEEFEHRGVNCNCAEHCAC